MFSLIINERNMNRYNETSVDTIHYFHVLKIIDKGSCFSSSMHLNLTSFVSLDLCFVLYNDRGVH